MARSALTTYPRATAIQLSMFGQATLRLPWSNGAVEGQVPRLKHSS